MVSFILQVSLYPISLSLLIQKHVSFVCVGGGGVRVEQGHLRPLCPAQRSGPGGVLCSLVRTLQGMDGAKKISLKNNDSKVYICAECSVHKIVRFGVITRNREGTGPRDGFNFFDKTE
jgi:hypothetical protein